MRTVFGRLKIGKNGAGHTRHLGVYPDSSLADLYDELTIPIELRKARQSHRQFS